MYPHRPIGLVIAGKTRWWGKIKQNKRFLRLKPALTITLEALINDDDIAEHKKLRFEFNYNDWAVFTQFAEILSPFKEAIKELEGEKYPTLSLVLKHIYTLRDFVVNRLESLNRARGAGINERVGALLTHLRNGLNDIIAGLPEEAYLAALLDPRMFDTFHSGATPRREVELAPAADRRDVGP